MTQSRHEQKLTRTGFLRQRINELEGMLHQARQTETTLRTTIETLQHTNESLRHLAIHDPLTGLYNRRYLDEMLDHEIRRALLYNRPLAVLMMDIDHFRALNTRYGHDGGDAVLRGIGRLLNEFARVSSVVCRYGGEEFTIIMPDTTLTGAFDAAETIKDMIAGLRVCHHDQWIGNVTVSIGIASFPRHGSDAAALIRAADCALYRAKDTGRNRVLLAA